MSQVGRTFLRGVTSGTYGLSDHRRAQLDAPRVRGDLGDRVVDGTTPGYSAGSKARWRLSPDDDPFLTQTLQVHFVDVHPDTIDAAHAHQNEAGHADTRWETTRDGQVRIISSPERTDQRLFSVDVYQQRIPAGSRSAKHWHMADEVVYVMSGSGHGLHWAVEVEIADKYYARIAKEPTRHDCKTGDTVYVPQNTVHQHVAADGEDVVLLSAQNRLFRWLGYDNVAYLEDAPEYTARPAHSDT